MVRFIFTTVTFVSYQKIPSTSWSVFCQHDTLVVYYCYVCIFFDCLPVYYSFILCLIQSYWVSKVRYCLQLVCTYSNMTQKKKFMSRLTNPITPTDFFITGIRILFVENLFIIVFGVNKSNWVSTDSQHILFPLIIPTHWTHTYSQSQLGWHFRKLKTQSSNVSFATFQWKEMFELWALRFETAFENVTPSGISCIYIYVCMYHNIHVLILSDMYIHAHTCVHVHTYVVFICTHVCRCIKLWNLEL